MIKMTGRAGMTKLRYLIAGSIAYLLGLLAFCLPAEAWINGQNAVFVIGQPDFISSAAGSGAAGLSGPYDVALDPVHGKLYVADGINSRVLRYAYPLAGDQPDAELVFGQPDFFSSSQGTARNAFSNIRGIVVDSSGRLWVSEFSNNRVVWFNNAYAISTNQPDADGVLGQPGFTSSAADTSQSGMRSPYGLVADTAGRLYVADAGNNRVLRFDNPAAGTNGPDADGVLGQPDFTSNTAALTQNGMDTPRGLALSGASLFVSDRNNTRVLRFDNAAARTNGPNADGVLGQPDFTSNTVSLTQNGMESPGRLASDSLGRLYVSDGFNFDRILIYNHAAARPNGSNADSLLGQPDFVSSGPGLGQARISLDSSAGGMAADNLRHFLLVADFHNNRVLLFQDPGPAMVTSQAVTDIGPDGATGNGTIVSPGSSSLTAHGMVWNTTGSPTLADSSTNEGPAAASGPFSSLMTGLLPNTTYFVRAYATNAAGTVYGNEVSFVSAAAPAIRVPALSQWGMMLFSALASAASLYCLRKRKAEV